MRKIFYIVFCSIWFLGCSQKSKQSVISNKQPTYDINQYIFPEAKDITEVNYVDKLNSQIKHYDKEPIYYLRINKENCLIEIYINDILMHDDYKISNLITPVKITGQILKSGPQKITVKMYPVGDLNNESFGVKDAPPITKLSEGSQVSVSVISIDEKSPKGLDDEKLITTQISPKEAGGKEYFEFSFTFDAKVPYEFEGWTKGQNLMKLDQKLVQKKALEFYEMVGQIHLKKDVNSWLKLNFPSNIRIMGSLFVDNQYTQQLLEEFHDDINDFDYEIDLSGKYEIEYMGNAALLRLRQTSLETEYRGSGLLCMKAKDGSFYMPGIVLYLPEGRDLATQGFMMWK